MICINNNAVINNYGKLQDHISLVKSPMGTQKMYSKFMDTLGMQPLNGSLTLG